MKNAVSGGKNMTTTLRVNKKGPSESRIKRLIRNKNEKKKKKRLNNGNLRR